MFLIPKEVPAKERRAAYIQFITVLVAYFPLYLFTYIAAAFIAAFPRKMISHPQGKALEEHHTQRYKEAGSSGYWEYVNSSLTWLRPWWNLEDGLLGEPSGKHSARVKGKERTWWSMYRWSIRNPFNWGKRTWPMFRCMVNECDVVYWGSYIVSDKREMSDRWQLVKATHRETGRVYYGFRSVTNRSDGLINTALFGFKIKPEHADIIQDRDDEDKAFTFRYQIGAKIN